MKAQIRYVGLFFLVISIAIAAGSCSRPSYIHVTYRPPAKSEALAGKSLLLVMKDIRSSDILFGRNAQEEFKYFTGIFSLSLAMGAKGSVMVGPFDLPSLFEESFKRRIQQSGVDVVSQPTSDVPVLEIFLNQFFLELVGRKWHADIAYEARLIKNETIVATQVVSGKAERIKVMGQGGAEKVIGDIFTEIVNKLDVYKLFLEAKLS